MKLETILTQGWHDDPTAPLAAHRLHDLANRDPAHYVDRLSAELEVCHAAEVSGLEQLFRRRTGGFDAIKQFVAALLSIATEASAPPLACRIDAIAYALLAGAKNFDLIAPPAKQGNEPFRAVLTDWRCAIGALESFERTGHPLPKDSVITSDVYLKVRKIVARPNARDERNILAALLVSGTSTQAELSIDLGLGGPLVDRILATFESVGMLQRRNASLYTIAEPYLPVALFGLRETLGLDPVAILARLLN